MKMGELRVRTDGGFQMRTPDGLRPVTLRCHVNGTVMVEEVTDGKMSLQALEINVTASSPAASALEEAAQQAAATIRRERS